MFVLDVVVVVVVVVIVVVVVVAAAAAARSYCGLFLKLFFLCMNFNLRQIVFRVKNLRNLLVL